MAFHQSMLRRALCCCSLLLGGCRAAPERFLRSFTTSLPSAPEVKITCGEVRGTWENGVAAFRGIPYGAAPIGTRRWKPAEAPVCWAPSILNATADGNICYQGGERSHENEDCLNLNVFAPSQHFVGREAHLPVFVWIYGGSNVVGSVDFYGEIENIVRKKDHVLVAMNYRLNIFGYLALPELSAVDPRGVSGNYGITDQQLALKWVRQNIKEFGGDPERITLIGQSSGGSNILAHLTSESSRGLFHRAIILSGSTNLTMTRQDKEAQDQKLILPRLSCHEHPDILSCLYNMSTAELFSAMPASYSYFRAFFDYPVNLHGLSAEVSTLLYVDGVTVGRPLHEALLSGFNDVPLLISGMQAELDLYPIASIANLTENELRSFYFSKFSSAYGPEVSQNIFDFYKGFREPQQAYAVYALDADTAVSCGNRAVALSAQHGFKSPVYLALVEGSPTHPFCAGQQSGGGCSRFPFHSWDFAAAAGIWNRINGMDANYLPSGEDVNFGNRLLSAWSDFATNGTLHYDSWRPIQDTVKGHLYTAVVKKSQILPVHDHKSDVCEFWESVGVAQQWYWIN
eukprot:TRINITY_DN22551_c0_g1_i1.p1 TRINITY_DN22551_c0_g1~~TRINITY_DN22551_c0_g1_i1.p1  ORF type:complete len:571 (+),score=79.44 TRINITY_DN22551_c0_g1_i1:70-1782(+)